MSELEAAVERVWPGRVARVEVLGGGITNHNLKVEVDGEHFVLRVAGKGTELLGIDREVELEATRAAAAAGIGPEVVAFVEPEGWLVTRFVDGEVPPPERMARAGASAASRAGAASLSRGAAACAARSTRSASSRPTGRPRAIEAARSLPRSRGRGRWRCGSRRSAAGATACRATTTSSTRTSSSAASTCGSSTGSTRAWATASSTWRTSRSTTSSTPTRAESCWRRTFGEVRLEDAGRSSDALRSARRRTRGSRSRARRSACWTTPHIASRKSDMNRISSRARGPAPRARRSTRRAARWSPSASNSWLIEKFARSKNAIAHARVLPVDDPEALAVVDEVRVEQVVVARHGGRRAARALRSGGDRLRPRVARRAIRRLDRARSRGRPRRRGTSRTAPGIGGASWIARRASATRAQHLRLAHPLERRRRALDEPRDEAALGLDERHHLGPEPDRGGVRAPPRTRPRGRSRGARCPSRRPQDEVLAVDVDLEVVVGDPAAEHLDAATGPATRARRQLRARSRADPLAARVEERLGGDLAARPTRRRSRPRPRCPAACSAGRYAYAIERSTV